MAIEISEFWIKKRKIMSMRYDLSGKWSCINWKFMLFLDSWHDCIKICYVSQKLVLWAAFIVLYYLRIWHVTQQCQARILSRIVTLTLWLHTYCLHEALLSHGNSSSFIHDDIPWYKIRQRNSFIGITEDIIWGLS